MCNIKLHKVLLEHEYLQIGPSPGQVSIDHISTYHRHISGHAQDYYANHHNYVSYSPLIRNVIFLVNNKKMISNHNKKI